jgi:hypothetical protein
MRSPSVANSRVGGEGCQKRGINHTQPWLYVQVAFLKKVGVDPNGVKQKYSYKKQAVCVNRKQPAKRTLNRKRKRKSKSDVIWEEALKQKDVKQTGAKQGGRDTQDSPRVAKNVTQSWVNLTNF